MNTATTARSAILAAKNEVAQENQRKAIDILKKKLRELEAAQVIVNNIQREITDLEQRIEQGNI